MNQKKIEYQKINGWKIDIAFQSHLKHSNMRKKKWFFIHCISFCNFCTTLCVSSLNSSVCLAFLYNKSQIKEQSGLEIIFHFCSSSFIITKVKLNLEKVKSICWNYHKFGCSLYHISPMWDLNIIQLERIFFSNQTFTVKMVLLCTFGLEEKFSVMGLKCCNRSSGALKLYKIRPLLLVFLNVSKDWRIKKTNIIEITYALKRNSLIWLCVQKSE